MHRAPKSKFRFQNPDSKIRAPPGGAQPCEIGRDEWSVACFARGADCRSRIQNPKSKILRPPLAPGQRRRLDFVGSSRDPRCAEVRSSPSQQRRPQEICSAREEIFCSNIILPEIDKRSKIQNPRPAALARMQVLLRFQNQHSAASAAWSAEQNNSKSYLSFQIFWALETLI